MTDEEARALLSVGAGASKQEVRRAYLKCIKVNKPDRDPEAFQRIRGAYDHLREQLDWLNLDTDGDPQTAATASEPSDHAAPPAPSAPSAGHSLSAEVNELLDGGHVREALDVVLGDAWAASLVEDPQLRYTTVRVAEATVLSDPEGYAQLTSQYADVLQSVGATMLGGGLAALEAVSGHWRRFKILYDPPLQLCRFVEQFSSSDEDVQTRLSAELCRWFWRDVDHALTTIDDMTRIAPHAGLLVSEMLEQAEDFLSSSAPRELEIPGAASTPHPRRALRPLTAPFLALAAGIMAAVFVTMVQNSAGSVFSLMVEYAKFFFSPLLPLLVEGAIFERSRGLRRRYLEACIALDQQPADQAVAFRGHPILRRVIRRDLSLQIGWQIGRLARWTQVK